MLSRPIIACTIILLTITTSQAQTINLQPDGTGDYAYKKETYVQDNSKLIATSSMTVKTYEIES